MSKAGPAIAIRTAAEVTGLGPKEDRMTEASERIPGKRAGGSDKNEKPAKGGDHIRQARQWGGGSKASKGGITPADRRNENSSAKS